MISRSGPLLVLTPSLLLLIVMNIIQSAQSSPRAFSPFDVRSGGQVPFHRDQQQTNPISSRRNACPPNSNLTLFQVPEEEQRVRPILFPFSDCTRNVPPANGRPRSECSNNAAEKSSVVRVRAARNVRLLTAADRTRRHRKNRAPRLRVGPKGSLIQMAAGSRIQLGEAHLRVGDTGTEARKVRIEVEQISPVLDLEEGRLGGRLRQFTLADLRNRRVFLVAEESTDKGPMPDGHITFIARDAAGGQSEPVTLRVTFAPVQVVIDRNLGLRLAHHSSEPIKSALLHSYCASPRHSSPAIVPELSSRYSIVDQPKFGVVECQLAQSSAESNGRHSADGRRLDKDNGGGHWALCSVFLQADIDALRVRYKHTHANRSQADGFDFQTHCAESSSPVQVFQIDFLALSVRVFVQESLSLNQTDHGRLSRRNLLATVFPHNFHSDQLIFHVLEAPKLGMLLRMVPESGKQRRVGISSNFSQQQVDRGLVSYKLHFAPFSVLNDFFTFRLVTPAGPSDELFRFDIVYLPGGGIGQIHLRNRTLVVPEGGVQKISNDSLWLETADGTRQFTFRVVLLPLNGRLLVGAKEVGLDGTFRSEDILAHRLAYEHGGDESRWDRTFLLAESDLRDPGGGKGHTPIPIGLTMSVLAQNNRAPVPAPFVGPTPEIHVLEHSERTLWPSLLPWSDPDQFVWPALEQSRLFPVAQSDNPLTFKLLSDSRDFVICSRDTPETVLREFNVEYQLKRGQLILRHLGGARNKATLRFTVSDGRNRVNAQVLLSASANPFLRLASVQHIWFPASSGAHRSPVLFLLTGSHLRAQTNLDVPDSALLFRTHSLLAHSPFHLLHQNGTLLNVAQFSQEDVFSNRLFLSFHPIADDHSSMAVPLKLFVEFPVLSEELVLHVHVGTNETANGIGNMPAISIGANTNQGLVVQRGGSVPLDGQPLALFSDGGHLTAQFHITRMPRHGSIICQRRPGPGVVQQSANYNIPLLSFDSLLLLSGSVQYVQDGGEGTQEKELDELEDQFGLALVFRQRNHFSSGPLLLGPFSVPVHIVDRSQLQLLAPHLLTISPAYQLSLDSRHLQLSVPSDFTIRFDQLQYQIVRPSPLVTAMDRRNGQHLDWFSHVQLASGDVLLMPSPSSVYTRAIDTNLLIRVCDRPLAAQSKCSRPVELKIRVEGKRKTLVLEKNIPLQILVGQQSVPITGEQLRIVEADGPIPPGELLFSVWGQKGGRLSWTTASGGNAGLVANFTQEDLDTGKLQFELEKGGIHLQRQQKDGNEELGFHFFYGDRSGQSDGPEWFSIRRGGDSSAAQLDKVTEQQPAAFLPEGGGTVNLARNQRLNAAPGEPTPIGTEQLHAVGSMPPEKLLFRLTKPPSHGRLLLNGSQGRVHQFSQADIAQNRVVYLAEPEIGAWSQTDHFRFKLIQEGQAGSPAEDHKFEVDISLAHWPRAKLDQLVPRSTVTVSKGGSRSIGISHINLTKLAALADDDILVRLGKRPAQGWLERLDEFPEAEDGDAGEESHVDGQQNWPSPLPANLLHSGLSLVYRHNLSSVAGGDPSAEERDDPEDEFTLLASAARESSEGRALELAVRVRVREGSGQLKVLRFPRQFSLVWGGLAPLGPAEMFATHSSASPSQVHYRVVQAPGNGVRIVNLTGKYLSANNGEQKTQLVTQFSQKQVDGGEIGLEHSPGTREWDLIDFELAAEGEEKEGHCLVLLIRIEPLALQLRNHSAITLTQGRTYVLLNRTHLGAESNSDRAQILYNITKAPENGTFYWVDGEKEAHQFSQKDIDNGDVLYAQMNMEAFQDEFEFVLSNEEMELLPKKGHIRVRALFQAQPLFTNSRTITQLGLTHLNATVLEGTSPRYLLVQEPKYGRLFLHPRSNESASFFTHNDVAQGRLFFHAFEVSKRMLENVVLELRSDNVQPARISWPIEIRPGEGVDQESQMSGSRPEGVKETFPAAPSVAGAKEEDPDKMIILRPPPPDMNYHFPVAILVAVVALVVGILLCRRRGPSAEGSTASEEDGDGVGSKSEEGTSKRTSAAALKSSLKRKGNISAIGGGHQGNAQESHHSAGPGTAQQPQGNGGVEADGRRKVRNILDSTVYATINTRQAREHNSSVAAAGGGPPFPQTTLARNCEEGQQQQGRPSELPLLTGSSREPSSFLPLHFQSPSSTVVPRRRSSPTRRIPTIALPHSRSESKERQQLLASAVAAAIASKQEARKGSSDLLELGLDRDKGEKNPTAEKAREALDKNEFWV